MKAHYYDVFRRTTEGLKVERHVMIDDEVVQHVKDAQTKAGKHTFIYRQYPDGSGTKGESP